MIEADSCCPNYLTRFSDGIRDAVADTTPDKGGRGAGFRPHDLLEAALATCTNMTVRVYAERHGIPLRRVVTTVELDRSLPEKAVFRCSMVLEGDLTEDERRKLEHAATACPVRRTLSQRILFSGEPAVPRV